MGGSGLGVCYDVEGAGQGAGMQLPARVGTLYLKFAAAGVDIFCRVDADEGSWLKRGTGGSGVCILEAKNVEEKNGNACHRQ